MKIYFCDGCNESIPLADIQSGVVTTIKGKLFCRICIPAGALAGPTASTRTPRPRAARGHPLLMLLVLLLLVWTAWRDQELLGLSQSSSGELAEPSVDPNEEARRRLMLLESELYALSQQIEIQSLELAGVSAAFEAQRAEDADRDKALGAQGDELARLAVAQQVAGQLVERVQINANSAATLELRVDALSQAVAAHEADLDQRLAAGAVAAAGVAANASSGGGSDAGMGLPVATSVDPAHLAALDEIRRLLLDPEPDLRFQGVDDVERGNYRELADDLIPLLQDEDMFVRLHAMNVLGNFGHEAAVSVLFDVLDDGNASIRKSAAETLVRLTGYDPGFEHKGSAGERSRAIKKWRDWYESRGA